MLLQFAAVLMNGGRMITRCRLCGAEELKLYYTQGDRDQYEYYRCPRCGLVNYDLSGGLDQGKYAERYIDPRESDHRLNRLQTESYRFLKSNVPGPGRLLEVGCGNGRLLMLARENGWEVRGLELSPFLAESVRQHLGIEVEVADFMSYQPEEEYDLVVLRHVLEHLPEPLAAMGKIRSLLRSEGNALLEFPNVEGWEPRFKHFLHRSGIRRMKYSPDYVPGHCNEFCRSSFALLVQKTGFELQRWLTYSDRPILDLPCRLIGCGRKVRALIRRT
ncbi:methyltransferase domain-containing protein [Candidatus Fermentibacteria bacterium]|nr:methyltransferase domain-containing protein [Candidatus Fermentibacteria bacterium]